VHDTLGGKGEASGSSVSVCVGGTHSVCGSSSHLHPTTELRAAYYSQS